MADEWDVRRAFADDGVVEDRRAPRVSRRLRPEYSRKTVASISLREFLNSEEYSDALNLGKLTVVIGAEGLDARDSIFTMCQHIPADPILAGFHASLVAVRLDGRVDLSSGPTGELMPCEGAPCRRAELVSLAMRSHSVYSRVWAASSAAVGDWSSHTVSLEPDDVLEITHAIARCRQVLSAFPSMVTMRNLADRLVLLEQRVASGGRLRGSEIEWLADVAWSSLLDDQSVPPRGSELFTRVSLAVNPSLPLEKSRTSSDVHRVELTSLSEEAAAALRPSLGFLGGHASRIQALQNLGRYLSRAATVARYEPTVVFTSTYGLEVEYGMGCLDSTFRVAFPVIDCIDPVDGNRLRWCLQTFVGSEDLAHCDDPRLVESFLTNPCSEPEWLDEAHGDSICEPLIIKINGSPLHLLPGAGKELSQRYFHLPSFDAFDLFQRLASDLRETDEERSVFGELHKMGFEEGGDRCWVHLGHQLSEMTARVQLQMLRQVSAVSVKSPSSIRHYACIDKDAVDFPAREMELKSLGITPIAIPPIEFLRGLKS